MRVSGTLYIGEAAPWARKACGKLNGAPWIVVIAIVVSLLGLGLAAFLATVADILFDALEGWWSVTFVGFAVLTTWASLTVLRRLQVAWFRRALVRRDVRNPLPVSFEIEPDRWTYVLGVVESRGPWSVISEIIPVGPYWVLLTQGAAQFLARRHFPDSAAERLFVQAVLEHLSPDARARSAAAARFVAS